MRLSACLALLLLVAWAPGVPPAQAAISDAHRIDVELQLDRSERVTWRFSSPDASRGFEVPWGAAVVSAQGATARVNGTWLELDPPTTLATIVLTLPPPDESLHPLYSRRLALPLAARVELAVRAPEGFALFHASSGQIVGEGSALEYTGHGGAELVYAYRSPYDADTGLVEIDEGIYHLIAPARSELAVRRIAALASEASLAATTHAGLALPQPIWVRFAPDRAFGEEAGWYGNDGIVAIRRDALSMGVLDGHPWRAAETLAHETFHFAALPHGDARLAENVTWWIEGSARYSERFVTGVDGWRACEAGWCVTFQSQLNATQVRTAYDGTFHFLPGWTAHSEARYRHAAYLVGVYADRYGAAAYRSVWEDVRAASQSPSCACDEAWLLQRLIYHSGGRATRDEIYRPFGDLRADDRAAFDARIAPLVGKDAPPATPTPWRPAGAANASDAPPPPRLELDPPLVGVPDALLAARLAGASAIEDADPGSPPNARFVVRLDGARVTAPVLVGERGRFTLGFVELPPGDHRVELEAVTLHGLSFVPPLKAEARFLVHPPYAIVLDPLPPGVTAPPVLVSGVVRDASTNASLADVPVGLVVDGTRVNGTRTGPDGRFYVEVLALPRAGAPLAVVVEDNGTGAPLLEAPVGFHAPAPLLAGGAPAASIEQSGARGTPAIGPALSVVAIALLSLAARRRR